MINFTHNCSIILKKTGDKMFKKSILAISVVFAISTLHAQAPEKKYANQTKKSEVKESKKIDQDAVNAAKELFKEMKLEKVYQYAVNNATANVVAINPKFKKIESKIKDFYEKTIGWSSIKDDIAKLYAKYYTVDELKKLTEFYKTPLGQKTLKVTPKLSMEGQKIVRAKLKKNMDKLKAMLDKAVGKDEKSSKEKENKK